MPPEDWWRAKVQMRELVRALKRRKSTIFWDIKRNFWSDDAFPKKLGTSEWPRIRVLNGGNPLSAS